MRKNSIEKIVVFVVMGLFFGMSVISSSVNIVEKSPNQHNRLKQADVNIKQTSNQDIDFFDNSQGLLSCDHLAIIADNDSLYEFPLNDPSDLTCICYGEYILSHGGTWANNSRILTCEHYTGALYEIYPDTCEINCIGGGGQGILDTAYDPTTGKLYGGWATGSSGGLLEIDPETGEQTYIGDYVNSNWIIGLAFDAEGTLYGWDISPDWLYLIDLETGEATPIGPLGINIGWAPGDFCMEDDILYLAIGILDGFYLYECDKNSGECTLVGQFGENITINYLVIPFEDNNNILPIAEFNWTPTLPEPGEIIIFNASESNDPDGYIKLYEWDWDNDGIFDEKNYSSPIATHIFKEKGYYPVTLRVKDNNFSSKRITKTVRVGNDPPNPPIIDGQKSGKVGVEYKYTFTLSDPENDPMYLRVDWGDGTPEPWQGPFDSDETVRLSHNWSEKGNYTIRAQVKDIYGNESDWATHDIIIDSEAPYIEITKPQRAIYIRDRRIIPFIVPVIFGDIQIWFSAEDSLSGLNRIELFIDDELKEIFTICPKSWLWNETTPWKYKHVIKLIAYDNVGNYATKKMTVWRFF